MSKMAITLELKFCLSNSNSGIEAKVIKVKILIFHITAVIFLNPYFWPIFANFQNEADCLSLDSLIDKDPN